MLFPVINFKKDIDSLNDMFGISTIIDPRRVIKIKRDEKNSSWEIVELLDVKKAKTRVMFKDEKEITKENSNLIAILRIIRVQPSFKGNKAEIFTEMDIVPILFDESGTFLASDCSNYDGFEFVEDGENVA